jgi:hypothetical protein
MRAAGAGVHSGEVRSGDTGTARTAFHLLLVAAAALLVCWPVLVHGVPDLAHDSVHHAVWTKNFDGQLWAGEWYPRWLTAMNGGLGAPVFFFYPALPSYASSISHPFLAGKDPAGWLQAGFGCALGFILSGITAYFWLRSLATPAAALFGAVIYLIAPYHTAIDLYNRGAISEFWTFVWMPLVMLSAQGLSERRRLAFPALSCSYALLICSHLGVTMCFSAVPIAAALLLSEPGRRVRTMLTVIAAMALGGGLAAVFAVPAMLSGGTIHMELVVGDDFADYRKWFLFQRPPSPLDFKARILILTLTMVVAAAVLLWLCLRSRPRLRERAQAVFYFGVGMVSFFFMTQASWLFWRLIPPLRALSFPYRFNTVLTPAVAALAALAFADIRRRRGRPWLVLAALALVWIGADAWSASAAFSAWRRVPEERTRPDRLQHEHMFWPKTSRPELRAAGRLEEFLAAHPARSLELRSAASGQAIGKATVADWQPRRIELNVDAPEKASLTIGHFYYPGWRGRIGGAGRTIAAGPTSPDGLILMEVPRGRYNLVVELARQGPERAGIAISLCSLAIVLGIAAAGAIKRRRAAAIP